MQHTHPFNGPISGTTRLTQYQKGKTNLDFSEARHIVSGSGISAKNMQINGIKNCPELVYKSRISERVVA